MSNHPRRSLVIIALSVLAMMLGVVFMPTLLAQRVASTQQDAPLKTLTLSGKVGTNRRADPQAGRRTDSQARPRPQPLSQAQRAILFKGRARAATKSFLLTPGQPTFSDKAGIYFMDPFHVFPDADGGDVWFNGGSRSHLGFLFKGKAGQLYAIDISVGNHPALSGDGGIYTLSNLEVPGATQTMPYSSGGLHITAYVTPEQDGQLRYELRCSGNWFFYSIEVTEL